MVIGFIGLGSMASAMVRGIAAAQLEGVALCGHNPHPEKAKALAESCGLRLCASNREVLERSDVVVLAVKPQILEGVLEEIAPLAAGKLFLSVAAGQELAWLSAGPWVHRPRHAQHQRRGRRIRHRLVRRRTGDGGAEGSGGAAAGHLRHGGGGAGEVYGHRGRHRRRRAGLYIPLYQRTGGGGGLDESVFPSGRYRSAVSL